MTGKSKSMPITPTRPARNIIPPKRNTTTIMIMSITRMITRMIMITRTITTMRMMMPSTTIRMRTRLP